MARVIFCVILTDAIRVRMALRDGIGSARLGRLRVGRELLAELGQRRLHAGVCRSSQALLVVALGLRSRSSSSGVARVDEGVAARARSGRATSTGQVVDEAVGAGVDDRRPASRPAAAAYWPCLRSSTMRAPRASCCCVALSRSEPNCANAASSRYCASSRRSVPATFFMRLDLRGAADAADRDADVHGRADARVEQVGSRGRSGRR